LDRDETIELIKERISKVGGSSLEPFTQQAVIEIYDRTGGFPREVLRACNDCVVHASREGLSIIDEQDVSEVVSPVEEDKGEEPEDDGSPADLDDLNLTPKQENVLEVLHESGRCTSGDVVDELGTEEYTSRSHAVRSVNNILKRLMENDVVDREKEGRSYSYFVSE